MKDFANSIIRKIPTLDDNKPKIDPDKGNSNIIRQNASAKSASDQGQAKTGFPTKPNVKCGCEMIGDKCICNICKLEMTLVPRASPGLDGQPNKKQVYRCNNHDTVCECVCSTGATTPTFKP